MMIIDDTLLQYALLATNALLIGTAGLIIVRLRKDVGRLRLELAKPAGDDDLRRLFDRHLAVLEQYLEQQASTEAPAVAAQPAISAQASTPAPVAAEATPAIPASADPLTLARAGAGIDELVTSCGLNRGEAQLLIRLHGAATPATH